MRTGFVALAVLLMPVPAAAQGSGELWEIQMNMPGMPAGMMPARRVCQGDDPARATQDDPNKRDCKVTDSKKSATRTTVTLSCKDGSTMVIDQQYNAARTEFKSTMSTKGGRQGDFTMNMTGRKVGACDAVAERKAQQAQVDSIKKQAAAGAAAGAAAMKQQSDNQVKQCSLALEKMNWQGFGVHGQCYKSTDKTCASMMDMQKQFPEASKACNANLAEFCKRFQGAEGFMRASQREQAAKMCGVTIESIKATQCPRVAKTQSPLSFLGGYCPVEAKPIAMEHCAGRDYTSKMGGKYAAFCENYLANADFERPPGAAPARAASGTVPSESQGQSQAQKSADAVKEGVSQGINKLRGLFGGK